MSEQEIVALIMGVFLAACLWVSWKGASAKDKLDQSKVDALLCFASELAKLNLENKPESQHGQLIGRANAKVIESNTERIEDLERWVSKQERIKQFELNENRELKND